MSPLTVGDRELFVGQHTFASPTPLNFKFIPIEIHSDIYLQLLYSGHNRFLPKLNATRSGNCRLENTILPYKHPGRIQL